MKSHAISDPWPPAWFKEHGAPAPQVRLWYVTHARLVEQIKQAVAAFVDCMTAPALIGRLALAAHRVVRATRVVDFLADADDSDRLREMLLEKQGAPFRRLGQ